MLRVLEAWEHWDVVFASEILQSVVTEPHISQRSIPPSLFSFCDWDKYHDQKQLEQGRVYIQFTLPGHFSSVRKSRPEPQQELKQEPQRSAAAEADSQVLPTGVWAFPHH